LTPQAIAEALKAHRVFATNGARVTVDARANGAFMGEAVRAADEVELTLQATSPKPIERAVLIRDGKEVYSAARAPARFSDRPGPGFHWYYWRIELQGSPPDYPGNMKVAEGNLAWSSPHRVQAGSAASTW
jgi:hypothetical protein